jgi:LemA protein
MNSTILAVVAIVLVLFVIIIYNRLVTLRNYVKEAFSTMDVYLKKRWDLVPNLIEVVKNYAQHEKTLLEELTKLRSGNYNDLSAQQKLDTNVQLGQKLMRVMAVAENYPDLKANESYMLLMKQLSAVEEDIANARKYYNGTVRELNTYLDMFPTNLIGQMFGFKKAQMFAISDEQRQTKELDL